MNKELISKAKKAKTPEELLCLAQENGEEMTEESAKAYFELLHPKTGKIADEELDNVAGGGCHTDDGREIVTVGHGCTGFECKKCGSKNIINSVGIVLCKCGCMAVCNNCKYCTYEKGLWLCNKSNHRKNQTNGVH